MADRGKRYRQARASVDRERLYTPVEAIRHGLRRLLPLIGTSILMYLAIFGGLILLIIFSISG
jgi:hypothetical protein